jgi:putative transposase
MEKMGLQSIAPKPGTSKPHPEHRVYPYLLRNMEIICPDQVWCPDITYIPITGGFVYLVAMMDWYSRYVLSREVPVSMESNFCVSARRHGRPDIFNTDQGSQFTSKDFTGALKDAEVLISMDGKGRAMDNVFIERLWRSVKYEEVYLQEYDSVRELYPVAEGIF